MGGSRHRKLLGPAIPLVFVIAACNGGSGAGSTGSTGSSPTTPTMELSPAVSAAEALDAIVVGQDAAPTDTEFRKSFSGEFSGTQMVQDSAPEVRSAVLEGWIDALTREFASPETNDVIEGLASPDDLDPSDLHFVGSLASAYENAEAAQDAMEAIRREMQPGSRGEETLSLGDGGVMFHEPFLGKTSFTFLWTSGPFLLVVRSDGMDENEMNALAEGMQSRVPAA